jgi:hypothetical protein
MFKVLAGIMEPPTGSAHVRGRVSALLDLSLGMDMEATSYENIIMRVQRIGEIPFISSAHIVIRYELSPGQHCRQRDSNQSLAVHGLNSWTVAWHKQTPMPPFCLKRGKEELSTSRPHQPTSLS